MDIDQSWVAVDVIEYSPSVCAKIAAEDNVSQYRGAAVVVHPTTYPIIVRESGGDRESVQCGGGCNATVTGNDVIGIVAMNEDGRCDHTVDVLIVSFEI